MSFRPLRAEEIGGAKVRRRFNIALVAQPVGKVFKTPDELALIRSIPVANRNSLIENRYLDVWPIDAVSSIMVPSKGTPRVADSPSAVGTGAPATRHMVSAGFGKFLVFEGERLTPQPIAKDLAEAMVAAAMPRTAPAVAAAPTETLTETEGAQDASAAPAKRKRKRRSKGN